MQARLRGAAAYAVEQRLTVNARAAGPRLGRDVQTVIKGSKSGDWSVAGDGTVTAGGFELQEGEYTLETVASEATAGHGDRRCCRAAASWCSTPRSPPSWRPRAWRATWCAASSRPAARPDSTCRTGSRSRSPGRTTSWRPSRTHEELVAGETLATSVAYEDAAETGVSVTRA